MARSKNIRIHNQIMVIATQSIWPFEFGSAYKLVAYNVIKDKKIWHITFQFDGDQMFQCGIETDMYDALDGITTLYGIAPFCSVEDWDMASSWYWEILIDARIGLTKTS